MLRADGHTVEFAPTPGFAGRAGLEFTVTYYRAGMTFELWKASSLTGQWARDPSATAQTLIPDSRFRFTAVADPLSNAVYRIKAFF